MAARLGKVVLLAALIFAAGLLALSIANGAERWVGPAIIVAIVVLVGFAVRYVLISRKS